MVFDKLFFWNVGLGGFNLIFAFYPMNWTSFVQLGAASLILGLEINRQLHRRGLHRMQYEHDWEHHLMGTTMLTDQHLMEMFMRGRRSRLGNENNVNWRRDGF